MRKPSPLKAALKDSKKVNIGSWITLGHEAIAEIMANAGFEWLCVDLEHSTMSITEAGRLIRTIELAGAVPLVRLSNNDHVQIKRVMDAGAHGIIVPLVNTKEDALRAYQAMHYPPKGIRGVGLARGQKYGASFVDYKKHLESAVLIVQIEHKTAVENLEQILSMPEVDGYIVGPYDLSASMGFPGEFDRPDFKAAMAKIVEIGNKSGKAGGLHIVEPNQDQLKKVISEGAWFVAYSLDIRMLEQSCMQGIQSLK